MTPFDAVKGILNGRSIASVDEPTQLKAIGKAIAAATDDYEVVPSEQLELAFIQADVSETLRPMIEAVLTAAKRPPTFEQVRAALVGASERRADILRHGNKIWVGNSYIRDVVAAIPDYRRYYNAALHLVARWQTAADATGPQKAEIASLIGLLSNLGGPMCTQPPAIEYWDHHLLGAVATLVETHYLEDASLQARARELSAVLDPPAK